MRGKAFVTAIVATALLALPLAALAAYPDYDWVDHWGGFGIGPGQLRGPAGVDQGPYGEVFVADCENNRIQVFDADGTVLRHFGELGTADAQMDEPWLLEVTEDGFVNIADYGNDRISVWDTAGRLPLLVWQPRHR